MCFLGGRSVVAGDDEIDSGESPGLAAAAAEEGDAGQAKALRFGEGGENVGGVAARGEDDQQVAGTGEAGDLARERVFVAVIVADAGEQRAVGGKGDRGERAAILGVATDEFGGEMGGLGGAAAVAADEQLSAAAEGLENEAGRRVDLGLDPRQRVERGVGLREGGGQIHEGKVASSPRRVASRKTAQTMLATRCPVSSNFASMRLRTLTLRHFRNVAFARIECEGKRQFFVGANGQGKTNLLEAAGFLTAARSFRTTDSATLLMHGQTTAAVACTVEHPQLGETQITIKVHRHNKEIWCDQARVVRLVDYLGKFPTVVFSSQDLQLVRGAPAARRRWLDLTLAAMNGVYLQALQTYTRALAERNALLKKGGAVGAQLEAFEKVLAPAAAELIAQRTAGLNQLGASVAEAYGRLCDSGEKAALIYEPDVAEASAEALLARWESGRARDLQLRSTNVGPHRDDFALKVADQVAKDFGSEGQQRSLVLALRLAQAAWFHAKSGVRPVLLADDVLGELDPGRRRKFWATIDADSQVLATGTSLPDAELGTWQIFRVKDGDFQSEAQV